MSIVEPLLIGIGILFGVVGIEPDSNRPPVSFFEPVQPPRKVKVMARLGAELQAPPNTIRALEFSIADSAEWAEVDVRMTKDGHHVLFRVETLDDTTNGSGRVRDRTLAEIQSVDAGSKFARRYAGERIPALGRVFDTAHGKLNLKLNCLDVDPARLVRDVIDAKMESQVLISANPAIIESIRAAGGHELAFIAKWRTSDGFESWVEKLGPAAVEIESADATPEACREFHRRGIRVLMATFGGSDRRELWTRAIDNHADWILTDRAEEVLAMMSLSAIGTMPVRIAIHRGAGRYAPENTLPAFEKALRLGADFVEFDVRTTRDGAFFLLHDATLDRTTTGTGPLKDSDRARIEALDAGAWFSRDFKGTKVLSLDGFLDAMGTRAELYFDAKDISPEDLAQSLRKHGLIERAVVYQGVDYLTKLRAIAPEIRRMPPLRDLKNLAEVFERVRPYAVDARWSILSREMIDACHAKGVKVFSDALGPHETVTHYQRAIRDGIDVIQTDHPVRVLRAIEAQVVERSP